VQLYPTPAYNFIAWYLDINIRKITFLASSLTNFKLNRLVICDVKLGQVLVITFLNTFYSVTSTCFGLMTIFSVALDGNPEPDLVHATGCKQPNLRFLKTFHKIFSIFGRMK
jgi:hypothetical protein